ncbi:MAG: aspartate aminotransferase family protein [Acidimicrobiia bacterium]
MTAVQAGPGAATEDWLARYARVVAPVLPTYFDVVADHALGSWIWDVEGRRYLDLGSGIAVTNVGHRHPRVQAAVAAQLERVWHTSVVTRHTGYIALAERIGGLCPFFAAPRTFLCNSGAEAVDGAVKLARQATGRPGIVAFRRGFHGRTLGATSLTTAKGAYRAGNGPLLPDVHFAPYCTAGRVVEDLAELDRVLDLEAPARDVAALVVEPVLGEGGYVVPPVAWLRGLRARCDAHGILLVFDEVQCGVGRTGRPFAAETFGVTPDVILFAKGIASGLPLGGLVAPAAVMDRWPHGAHGTTFGGNPLACAAALATLDVLADEGLYERAVAIGTRVRTRLAAAPGPVVEVRGVGAMIGVELADRATAEAVQRRCLDQGVLVLSCGPEGNVLRLIPPLTISDEELDLGLDVLVAAMGAFVG